MRIALVTCDSLRPEEQDDRPFQAALAARGVHVTSPAWTDPAVDWAAFDAALIRTTWDYAPRLPAFLDWAARAAAATRLWNPLPVIRWNTDKRYLSAFAAAGIPIAPTAWVPARATTRLADVLAAHGWARALVKPVVGAGASDCRVVTAPASPADEAFFAEALTRVGLLVQPYLPSVESEGEVSLILVDEVPCHGVRKRPRPGDFRVQDEHGAADEPWSPEAEALAIARAAHAIARPWSGTDAPLLVSRVDLLRLPDGRWCLNELEAVEPSLFFRHGPATAGVLADALLARLRAAV